MNILKINIGLNNNPLNSEQLKQIFYKNNIFEFLIFEVAKGKYKNNYESTLIIEGETRQTAEQIQSYIFLLCTLLNQDCIPYTFADLLSKDKKQVNKLIYNKNYNGLKDKFNKNYFLTINNKSN